MIVVDVEQGSFEWLELRRTKFNASETAALFGVSPWVPRNELELAHLKYGDLVITENKRMADGKRSEDMIRDLASGKLGDLNPGVVALYDEDDRFLASFDALTDDGIPVELKHSHTTYEKLLNGDVPENYYLQVQHQLLVSGATHGYLVAFSDKELDIQYVRIDRDEDVIEDIIKRWNDFEEKYRDKELPPIEVVVEDEKAKILAKEYEIAKRVYDDAKKALELKKKELLEYARDDAKVVCENVQIIPVVKETYDYKKAALDAGVDLEKYKKKSKFYTIRTGGGK